MVVKYLKGNQEIIYRLYILGFKKLANLDIFSKIKNKYFYNLREKILAWTRIRTRVSSSTRWRYNH